MFEDLDDAEDEAETFIYELLADTLELHAPGLKWLVFTHEDTVELWAVQKRQYVPAASFDIMPLLWHVSLPRSDFQPLDAIISVSSNPPSTPDIVKMGEQFAKDAMRYLTPARATLHATWNPLGGTPT